MDDVSDFDDDIDDTTLAQKEVSDAGGTAEGGFRLALNVEATPDLTVHIPVDITGVSVDMRATGAGDLQLIISSSNPFMLLGDYELEGGTVSLDLMSLVNREFTIDEGSTITFPGSIGDSRLNISAAYSQRVNMSSLTGSLGTMEAQKPVTVENVVTITQSLQSPEIKFDIRLPNADQTVQEEVFAYIDRNNEQDMLTQTVSLLAAGQFYNMSGNTDLGTGNIREMGYSRMANILGSLVSSMVDFVDVSFDYKSGNSLTTEQYDIDISKEWNKFYFESTFGFGGEARDMRVVNNNNLTGDVLLGYKINPRLHLFVFNRSNTNDYTRSDLPYKQGLGLKYTRDFDRFVDLFIRSNRKSKNDRQ